MEETAIWDILQDDDVNDHPALRLMWAYPLDDSNLDSSERHRRRGADVCERVISSYRCPSAGLPEHMYDTSRWGVVRGRVPGSYLACASGMVKDQYKPLKGLTRIAGQRSGPMRFLDGVMFAVLSHDVKRSGVVVRQQRITDIKIKDGVSRTVLVAEALHDVAAQIRDGHKVEYGLVRKKDHWYIGSQSIWNKQVTDMSEALGSFGVPLNMQTRFKNQNPCLDFRSGRVDCQALQLSFSSAHPGGINICLCDGSVKFLENDTDEEILTAYGTRASQEFEKDDTRRWHKLK